MLLDTYIHTEEDCLYLNVYVPEDVEAGSNKSVMVWIHGGGLTLGKEFFKSISSKNDKDNLNRYEHQIELDTYIFCWWIVKICFRIHLKWLSFLFNSYHFWRCLVIFCARKLNKRKYDMNFKLKIMGVLAFDYDYSSILLNITFESISPITSLFYNLTIDYNDLSKL